MTPEIARLLAGGIGALLLYLIAAAIWFYLESR